MNELKTYLPNFWRLRYLLVVMLVFAGGVISAQGWEKYFGGNSVDQGFSVIQTKDLGFLVTGFSESFSSDNDVDLYVVRTDVDGAEIWSRVYDEAWLEHGYSIAETQDNAFLIAGEIKNSAGAPSNVALLKIDNNGAKVFFKQYGGAQNDVGNRIIPVANGGGYLIAGTTASFSNGQADVFLIKINENGNEEWSEAYGTPEDDAGRGVVEVSDGFLVVGSAHNVANNSTDVYLLKVDFQGVEQWHKFIGGADIEEGFDLVATQDGNFAITGYAGSNSDAWLLKINPAGDTIWTKTFGGAFTDQAYDILETPEGDLMIAGITELNPVDINALIARFDSDGNELWLADWGRQTHLDEARSIAQTNDGGFVVAGYNSPADFFFINDVSLFKISAQGSVYTNHLIGNVFIDGGDCVLQPGEPGLNDWIVRATSPGKTFFGTTDANGNFDLTVDSGAYQVSVLVKNEYWDACIAGYNVSFNGQYDTLVRNFPILPEVECPLLEVDISTPVAQNCTNISYIVSYCNTGTVDANSPSVHIILDDDLEFISASIPVFSQVDSLVIFNLDPVAIDECANFTIIVSSDCSGQPAQAYTVSAHIMPDSICLPVSPNWDLSNVKVNGYCDADSIRFTIKNDGSGNMQQPLDFIIIEDQVMLTTDPVPFLLEMEEDTIITIAAGGSTYRLIAEQSPGHPGNSYPTVAVEGCVSGGGSYSTGYTNMFQEDENDPFVSIDVQETINPTDYIFLRGYPKGYWRDGENLIPANTDIEYHIYFQNAGLDTIDRLVIRDTLPSSLDLATVVAGASTHPYDFEVYSNGVLKFTFENMHLPPNGGAASQGFVKFKVAQKPDNPDETEIPNSAAVFLGYDAPHQTSTYVHTVCDNFFTDCIVISDVNEPEMPGVTVSVYPNPFASTIVFDLAGRHFKNLTISVFDMSGQLARREKASGDQLQLLRGGLPSGAYTYRLEADGQLLDTGKIIVR